MRQIRPGTTAASLVISLVLSNSLWGQTGKVPSTVDFGRDVQPLFKAHCIDCHGPKVQKNGFRLDRRRDAMKGGTISVIGRGNSAASRLYLKLIGEGPVGPRMPPDGPLHQDEINIIKTWIDQGATWPDQLAGEASPAPPDPKAVRLMAALREGDRPAFYDMLKDEPAIARLRGPGGATPLMYAVLYADVDSVRLLLECGAEVNARNEAGASALMWAVDDLEKSRLLVERGADVNARSADSRTSLLIASGQYGSSAVVKLLLDRGANPSVSSASYRGPLTPLREAADVGDVDTLRLLIERRADVKSSGPFPLIGAINRRHAACVDLLTKFADRELFTATLLFLGPPFGDLDTLGDANWVKKLLDHGADVTAKDPAGRTVLMLAAKSDGVPIEIIQLLIESGADINTKSASGETAFDFARQRGNSSIVELLAKAGAKEGNAPTKQIIQPKPAGSARAALERALPLLQRTDVQFLQKTGCVSCHHNSMTAMTIASARKKGLPVHEQIARQQLQTIASYVDGWRDRALQGLGIPGDSDTVSNLLFGLAAENYPPDPATDAMAHFLKHEQAPEGRWRLLGNRPPLESSEFEVTAVAMRALQTYGLRAKQNEYQQAVQRAADWLTKTAPQTTTDRAFKVLGLKWAGGNQEITQKTARELLAEQRSDGGWGQITSLASDAYATGQVLTALRESGVLAATDSAYQRGVEYLLSTQLEDGSWYVKSRSIAFQPYFESGFPHGHDQWISAAATNWAAMALIPATR